MHAPNPMEPRAGQGPNEIGPGPGERVWPPMNAGAIHLGPDQGGTLKTTTPFAEFEILITPESIPTVLHPSNEPVLVARVRRG